MRDFSSFKRIVVKVGTNLLSSADGIDENRINNLCTQIAKLREMGYQVLLQVLLDLVQKRLNIKIGLYIFPCVKHVPLLDNQF